MDIATLALIAAGISIVLQIIILGFVIKLGRGNNRKQEKPQITSLVPPQAQQQNQQNRFNQNRLHHENRFNRRPQENRSQASAPVPPPAAPSQTVDTSLRDINLRLKNAERTQENERKRINTNFSRDDRGDRGGDRDNRGGRDRGDRGGRDRGGRDNRGGRGEYRGQNRSYNENRGGQYGNDRPESEERPQASFEQPSLTEPSVSPQTQQSAPAAPTFEHPPVAPQAAAPVTPPVTMPRGAISDSATSDSNQEVFHGRKTTVKRRVLGSDQGNAETGANENTSGENDQSGNTPISFGRR